MHISKRGPKMVRNNKTINPVLFLEDWNVTNENAGKYISEKEKSIRKEFSVDAIHIGDIGLGADLPVWIIELKNQEWFILLELFLVAHESISIANKTLKKAFKISPFHTISIKI